MIHLRQDEMRIQDPENQIPVNEPVMLLRASDAFATMALASYINMVEIEADLCERRLGYECDNCLRLRAVARAVRCHCQRMRQWQQATGNGQLAIAPEPGPV